MMRPNFIPKIAEGLRSRPAVVGLVAATALTASGCSVELPWSDGRGIDSLESVQVFGRSATKTHDLNPDPSFRAQTVSILDGHFITGGGSLVQVSSGEFAVATVEHVARNLYGLAPRVESKTVGVGGGTPMPSKAPGGNVPGLGVLRLSDDAPDVTGPELDSNNKPTDRFVLLELSKGQNEAIRSAEAAGTLDVPEIVSPDTTFGARIDMPQSETGENVPFVVVGPAGTLTSSNKGLNGVDAVPLYLLDRGLNFDRGVQKLQSLAETRKAELDRQNVVSTATGAMLGAIVDLQEDLLNEVGFQTAAGVKASKYLACMGDSGSGFINKAGKVIGVLSSGQPFYRTGKAYSPYDSLAITRDGSEDSTRYCLNSITAVAP